MMRRARLRLATRVRWSGTWTRLSARLIGGQTGDVGGAIQQLAEIAAYLGLLIAARP